MPGRILPASALLLSSAVTLCALVGVSTAAQDAADAQGASAPVDPLADRGLRVTGGAAPGYVEDRVCARCHPDVAATYREVGMARSFYRPRADRFIEDFERSRFVHEPSGRHYEMVRSGDDLLFRRWEEDSSGEPINLFERKVDWIMGSGNHSRVYLYQTELGELYQLPTAWYTQMRGWGMAPGYDRPDHLGVVRRVLRECMFCHNAYPDVPAGSDAYGEPQLFPEDLPEGTGCQRCHGPGAEHVRLILGEQGTIHEAIAAIVNPGRLSPERRNDVCYECHMQPSVAIPGVRRFDRDDYSFRPGESLPEYRVGIDVVEPGRDSGERFEINHHPYRLEQSTCFRASGGALSCLTCHDPHRKVPVEERAAHYRSACLGCHETDACRLDAMAEHSPDALPEGLARTSHQLSKRNVAGARRSKARDASRDAGVLAVRRGARASATPEMRVDAALQPNAGEKSGLEARDPDDCVACHMPLRRTEDVVQVAMTDHRIGLPPKDPTSLLEPLEERDPEIVDVLLLDGERAPAGSLGQVYRAVAVIRTGTALPEAVDHLERSLSSVAPEEIVPRLDLAEGQLKLRRFPQSEETLREVLERAPDHARTREWLSLALAGQGKLQASEAVLRDLVADGTDRPETEFNFGRILLGTGRPGEAVTHLRRATELRPNLAAAWLHLGRALLALDRAAEAQEALVRSLALQPDEGRAYALLAEVLRARGDEEGALRYLRHGLANAADPEPVRRVLEAGAGD